MNFDITNLKISVSSFNESESSIDEMAEMLKNEIENQKNTNELNNEESLLSEEQAKTVLKNIVENSTVRHIYDNPGLTYCNNSEEKPYSGEELGLNYNWSYFQKCNDYNSYDELVKYFKNYFT